MYKSRCGVWFAIILAWGIITSFMRVDVASMLEQSQSINVEFRTDATAKSSFSEEIDGLVINSVNKNPDVIISTDLKEQAGFEKLDDYIYSPIICFLPTDFNHPSDMFYRMGTSSFFVNMKNIADAVINDKTLGDLGITDNEEYINNKIIFNIPSKGTLYYDAAIETLYISLNGNKVPTEKERKELEPTVSALIEKSVECNDVTLKIGHSLYGEYNIFLVPEFSLKNGKYFSARTKGGYYIPGYFEKSVALKYNIFVKQNTEDTSIKENIVKNIIENKNFCETTRYRTTYAHNYSDMWLSSGCVLDQLEIVN